MKNMKTLIPGIHQFSQLPGIHEFFQHTTIQNRKFSIIKSHLLLTERHPFFSQTTGFVYVIRNPIKVMFSNFNYLLLTSKVYSQNIDIERINNFRTIYFSNFIENCGDKRWLKFGMGSWKDNVESWLNNHYKIPGIVVRYEDLSMDTFFQITRICKFLNIDPGQNRIEQAILASSFSKMREMEEREIERKSQEFFYKPSYQAAHNAGIRFMNRGAISADCIEFKTEKIRFAESDLAPLMRKFDYL